MASTTYKYYYKALKYKNKYNDLLKKLRLDREYQLIHGTSSFDSLVSILQSQTINFGSNVDPKYRFLSGKDNPVPYIYMNINFTDLNNMSNTFPFSIVLSPNIMITHGVSFSVGWGIKPNIINIEPNDENYFNKIDKIKNLIKTRKYLPPIYSKASPWMQHELTFDKEIHLTKDNLIGIKCRSCTPEQLKILKPLIQQLNTKLIY